MATIKELKEQIQSVNALGRAKLSNAGIDLPETATTYDIMQNSGLPDWDDDSPIIASGEGQTYNGICNCVWELTEKGTLRWKMLDKNLTSNEQYTTAGWGNSALSVVSLDYQAIAPRIRQAYFEDGFRLVYIVYVPNCERVRFPDTLTKAPSWVALRRIKKFDASSEIYIGKSFSGWEALEIIDICPLETTLIASAFNQCYSLKEINLKNITTINQRCFYECFSLNKDIVFNKNLISIGGDAFTRTRIKSVKFQNSTDNLPSIYTNTFNQCRELTDIYCPWAEGAVASAPWGATNATIHYNTQYDENGNPITE